MDSLSDFDIMTPWVGILDEFDFSPKKIDISYKYYSALMNVSDYSVMPSRCVSDN